MKILNKTEQKAHSQGRKSSEAIQEMLMGYRSTPHPATGYCPYEALMRRNVRTKLDSQAIDPEITRMERQITQQDHQYKCKWQNRRQKTSDHRFKV